MIQTKLTEHEYMMQTKLYLHEKILWSQKIIWQFSEESTNLGQALIQPENSTRSTDTSLEPLF